MGEHRPQRRRRARIAAATPLLAIAVCAGVAVAATFAVVVQPKPADAAFPGENGRIAFDDNGQVFTVQPDGSDRRRLTHGPAYDQMAAFSPDGRHVVFGRARGLRSSDLFVVNANGRGLSRLTRTRRRSEGWPSFSPNGRRIVFARQSPRRGGHQQFDIYVMRANGSGVRRLTNTAVDERYPEFSPTGGRIAFERFTPESGAASIHLMDSDGSNRSRLTDGGAPSFSPDGARIAFDNGEIYRIDVDGTNRVRLTSESGFVPAYSPSGDRIAFSRYFPANPSGGGDFTALFTITENGADERRLAREGTLPDWGPRPK